MNKKNKWYLRAFLVIVVFLTIFNYVYELKMSLAIGFVLGYLLSDLEDYLYNKDRRT